MGDGKSICHLRPLISDPLNLAEADQLDYETVFNLSRYLEREIEYVPGQPPSLASAATSRQ